MRKTTKKLLRLRLNEITLLMLITFVTPVCMLGQDSSSPSIEYLITTDNDIFIPFTHTDKDYSFGLFGEVRFKGDSAKAKFFKKKVRSVLYSSKGGIMGFTPEYDREDFDPNNIEGRPFAGWLAISHNQYYVFDQGYNRIGLEAGLIGPRAHAGDFQNWFHREFRAGPQVDGWEHQIPNHVGVNLNGEFIREYGRKNKFMLYGDHSASLGNVFSNLEPSVAIRWGRFSSLNNFSRLIDKGVANKKASWFIDVRGGLSYKLYDATLQGNMFSNDEFFTKQNINNTSFIGSVKFSYVTERLAISMNNHFRAADLGNSERFSYGSLEVAFTF